MTERSKPLAIHALPWIGRTIFCAMIAVSAIGIVIVDSAGAPASAQNGRAVTIMKRAAQGNASAQARLGFMYATGQGVPQHLGEAVYWYRRAAEQGDGRAQYLLGLSYDKGRGVAQDLVMAHMWLNLAAASARGDDREHKVRVRDAIASKMTIAQFVMAEQLALAWRPTRER